VIELVLANPEMPFEWQVLVYFWRMSWGHNSDFAVDAIGGKRIGQNTCAEFFHVDKRRVSAAVVFLRGIGFILPGTGQSVYPSDCLPSANSGEPVSKVRPPADFSAFLDIWKVRAPADFHELESAEATVKRLKIVRLGHFQKWKKERTNSDPSLYTTPTTQRGKAAPSSSAAVVPAPAGKADEDLYSKFKSLYPSNMFDEPKAKPSFEELMPDDQLVCIERLHLYLNCERWRDCNGRWVPLASNWLKAYTCDPPPLIHRRDNQETQAKSIKRTADIARAFRGGGGELLRRSPGCTHLCFPGLTQGRQQAIEPGGDLKSLY
jgi:hypothetical protein